MPRAEVSINTTPLIDVLLVLLVLIILTLPRSTHKIALELPNGVPRVAPIVTRVDVDFDGRVYWNGTLVPDDRRLEQWFSQVADSRNVVSIGPDRLVRYERLAQVLAAAQRSHVRNIAVVPVSD